MEPNKPVDRFKYVVKQYGDGVHRRILYDVSIISLYLTGNDAAGYEISRGYYTLGDCFSRGDCAYKERYQREREDFESELEDKGRSFKEVRRLVSEELGSLEHYVSKESERDFAGLLSFVEKELPGRSQNDFLIPWVARELGRLNKEILKGRATQNDYHRASGQLQQKAPAIAMWAQQESVDLNKTTLADALEGVVDFEVERAEPVPQGEDVYRFEDGWTIQRLAPSQLVAEGEVMQHCVKEEHYHEAVALAETFVFSLRSPKGQPHVTIEWAPSDDVDTSTAFELKAFLVDDIGQVEVPGRFVQILGKQNEEPLEKYRPYVQEFIKARFNADPWGLLMVVMPGQKVSFAGRTLTGDVFDGVAREALRHADFRGARFERAFIGEDFQGISFDKVVFDDATFSLGTFTDCSFDRAIFRRCELRRLEFTRCTFLAAVFGSGHDQKKGSRKEDFTIYDVTFNNCSLRDVEWKGVGLSQVKFLGGSLEDSLFLDALFAAVEFNDLDLTGAMIRGDRRIDVTDATGAGRPPPRRRHVQVRGTAVILRNLDLSDDVTRNTVDALYEMATSGGFLGKNVKWPKGFDPERGTWTS